MNKSTWTPVVDGLDIDKHLQHLDDTGVLERAAALIDGAEMPPLHDADTLIEQLRAKFNIPNS